MAERRISGNTARKRKVEWDMDGAAFFLQLGAVGKQIATAFDPDLRDPYTGRGAIPQGDPAMGKKALRMMEILSDALFPQASTSMVIDVVKVGKVAAGQVVDPRKSGTSYNPIQALRVLNPILPIQTA